MLPGDWVQSLRDSYGELPKDYIALDIEYTGGDERTDFVMEIGHVLVKDCRVVNELNLVLDWTNFPGVDHDLLRYKLNNIQRHMGSSWRISWDVMRSEGVEAYKVLSFYDKLFSRWSVDGVFVAHNGRKAEERMLRGVFNRYLNKSFVIGDNAMWDTGAIYKAHAMLTSNDPKHESQLWKLFPRRSDTLKNYSERVLNSRGPKWNLTHCIGSCGLQKKLKPGHFSHQAIYDAYASHILLEHFRGLLSSPVTKTTFPVLDLEVPKRPEIKKVREQVVKRDEAEKPLPPPPSFSVPDTVPAAPENPPSKLPIKKPPTKTPTKTPVKPQVTTGRKRGQRVI